MAYGPPKPRTAVKDFKAYPWRQLEAAVQKVMNWDSNPKRRYRLPDQDQEAGSDRPFQPSSPGDASARPKADADASDRSDQPAEARPAAAPAQPAPPQWPFLAGSFADGRSPPGTTVVGPRRRGRPRRTEATPRASEHLVDPTRASDPA